MAIQSEADPQGVDASTADRIVRQLGAKKVTNALIMGESVKFAEELIAQGRYDEADRIHRAAVASVHGNTPVTLQHRYRLIRSAIRRGVLEEAYEFLTEQDRLVADAVTLAKDHKGWRSSALGGAHHLQVAWGEYYRAIGAVERAYEYRATAKAALGPFLGFVGASDSRRLERQFTHAQFEAALCFSAGRYRSALECLDGWIKLLSAEGETIAFDGSENLAELRRLKASALQLLASSGEGDPVAAREALLRSLKEAEGSPLARLDVLFSLVKLELGLGRVESARGYASMSPDDELTELDTCLSIALRLASATQDKRNDYVADLESALNDLVSTWLVEEPRPGGRGWLHYSRVRFFINVLVRAKLSVPATAAWDPIEGERAVSALDAFLPVLDVSDLARRLRAPAMRNTADLQACMLEGESALLLNPGHLPGVGFLVKRSNVTAFPVAGRESCKAALAGLNGVIGQAFASDWDPEVSVKAWDRTSSEVVSAFFPADILGQITRSGTLLFLARDLALQLPLESVRFEGAALCLQYSIADIPSPGVLALLRRRNLPVAEPGESVVLVANVPTDEWKDPGQPELASVRLGDQVLTEWKNAIGVPTALVQGANGGVEGFREGLLRGKRLGVIYAHGSLAPDPERPSALLVGARAPGPWNGRLSSALVETLPVADVMLLAACGSARAPQRVGSWGSNHLGGAFLLAGARAVLLSASDLPAEPTARLVGEFLGAAGRESTVGEAMLQARRAIAAGDDSVSPSDYARTIIFGLPEVRMRGDRPTMDAKHQRPPRAWWLLAIAGFGLAVVITRRRRTRAMRP